MMDWLSRTEVLNNPAQLWLTAAAAALLGYLIVHTLLHAIAERLRRRARVGNHPHGLALSLLESTSRWLILALAIVLAASLLTLPAPATDALDHAAFALIALQVALWANALIRLWVRRSEQHAGNTKLNPVLC